MAYFPFFIQALFQMNKKDAEALIKKCEEIRDGKGANAHFPYPAGPQRAAIDAYIIWLKDRFKI